MADGIYILKGPGNLDEHGQPRNRGYNAKRLSDRSTDELIGLSKALVADGKITDDEVAFLAQWVNANRQFCTTWPASVICARIDRIFEDKIVDPEERADLFALLAECVAPRAELGPENSSIALPITQPAPPVFFSRQNFCFTGRMVFGTRKKCQEQVLSRGGTCQDNVTTDLHYLVIGMIGSSDWMHTTHGRKIELAVEYQKRGHPIAVISEQHWTDHIL